MAGFATFEIRYDGLDADEHTLDLFLLGESLQGTARVLAVCGHFAATGKYAKQLQALDVKVYVGVVKEQCLTVSAVLEFAKSQQLFSGLAPALITAIISFVYVRVSGQEVKAIKESLNHAIDQLAGQNREIASRLLSTIDKMADSLAPAVRASVAPVGKSCSHMKIGNAPTIDVAMAEAIRSISADDVTDERTWRIYITELDLENRSGRIRFIDDDGTDIDDKRYRATITDPALDVTGNEYFAAFTQRIPISVRGKATMKDGEIQVLYISNTE